jgi:hypothetical protein
VGGAVEVLESLHASYMLIAKCGISLDSNSSQNLAFFSSIVEPGAHSLSNFFCKASLSLLFKGLSSASSSADVQLDRLPIAFAKWEERAKSVQQIEAWRLEIGVDRDGCLEKVEGLRYLAIIRITLLYKQKKGG